MTYIVHGATGAQGSPVLAELIAAGHDVSAAVRDPRGLPEGVHGIAVDLADTNSLIAAYRGAEGVFIHLPLGAPDQILGFARSIVAAVAEAKPARVVVSTSGAIVDEPGAALQAAPESAIATLISGIAASGVSLAVVAPRLYLENLLLPMIAGPAREEGVLRYPLPSGYPVSWSSHLDVAVVAARLLTDPTVTGTVAVGALPGLSGEDLAAGFAAHLGRAVSFEAISPDQFGELIIPMFGPEASAPIVGLYHALGERNSNVIAAENSAQTLLGLHPRSVAQWLAAVGA
ncbi:SDR family oxidoreductase [Mycetocola spongiae]|uniref:SDR family oxidoreductase n=1 Tax=Mycetocola spongiae TaxID=2859226 RepID=UPI001CF36171|nr:NmrA family NAD(P)-binding protein [Mycetocola spongiae]UCR90022.1 NmrA family NAD(P)-binding protein [Mycetocola spongiae]